MAVPDDREIPIVVSSLETYCKAISCARDKCLVQPWFRGHRDGQWPLLPAPFRSPLVRSTWRETHDQEHAIAVAFRAGAAIRREVGLADSDYFGWLSMMRHYQAACRLLDWSQSPLVALYFALCGKSQPNPPAVWVLDPYQFNTKTWGHAGLRYPAAWDHHLAADHAKHAFDPTGGDNDPIAVVPKENSLRMMVQRSMFTIHHSTHSLQYYANEPGILFRVGIAKRARTRLRRQLEMLGVNEQQLFPDLEQLASGIEEPFKGFGAPPDAAN